MKYALLLNDMRWPNIENIAIVKLSDSRDDLIEWYKAQLADKPWRDGQWAKFTKLDRSWNGITAPVIWR
jgi:hypothetical protein